MRRYIILIALIFTMMQGAKIKILQTLSLDNIEFDGFNFSEISGATYDKKNHILYLVSDKGILFKFYAFFEDEVYLKKIGAYYLRKKSGKRLKSWKRDSEGIALDKKGNLYISFEGKPTIAKFSKDGVLIKKLKLPKEIKKAKYKSKNKTLESLAYHPKYGLLTAFEYSVKPYPNTTQFIYSLKGKKWKVEIEPFSNNAITDIEYFNKNNILILERAYGGIFGNFAITLRKFNLKSKKSEVLYKIESANEDYVENFEALAKVGKNRFIMISDDNDSFFAKTILVYFEVVEE